MPKSRFCNFEIDSDHWVVSLIRAKRTNGMATNHAQIVVEGVDAAGNEFAKFAEFGGPSSLLSEEPDSYCCMGRTGAVKGFRDLPTSYLVAASRSWKRASDLVTKMMNAVDAESGSNRPFHILGRDSLFNSKFISAATAFGGGILTTKAYNYMTRKITFTLFTIMLINPLKLELPTILVSYYLGVEKIMNYLMPIATGAIGAIDHQTGDNCVTWAVNKLSIAEIIDVDFTCLRYLFNFTPKVTDHSTPSLSL